MFGLINLVFRFCFSIKNGQYCCASRFQSFELSITFLFLLYCWLLYIIVEFIVKFKFLATVKLDWPIFTFFISILKGDVYPVEPYNDFSVNQVLDANWGVLLDEDVSFCFKILNIVVLINTMPFNSHQCKIIKGNAFIWSSFTISVKWVSVTHFVYDCQWLPWCSQHSYWGNISKRV